MFDNLTGLAWALVIFGIIIGLGALVVSEFQGQMTPDSDAYNATGEALAGIGDLAGWTGTIVLIGVVVVIIGAVALIAGALQQRGGGF